MGCFNETCMVSSLPIREGDRATFYLLMPVAGDYGQFFKPILGPVSGRYNDYGGLVTTKRTSEFFTDALTDLLETGVLERHKSKLPGTLPDLNEKSSFDDLSQLVVRGDVNFANRKGRDGMKPVGVFILDDFVLFVSGTVTYDVKSLHPTYILQHSYTELHGAYGLNGKYKREMKAFVKLFIGLNHLNIPWRNTFMGTQKLSHLYDVSMLAAKVLGYLNENFNCKTGEGLLASND